MGDIEGTSDEETGDYGIPDNMTTEMRSQATTTIAADRKAEAMSNVDSFEIQADDNNIQRHASAPCVLAPSLDQDTVCIVHY